MRECYVCKTTKNLHLHHVFFGSSRRKMSDKYNMTVYLCGYHHNLSVNGVHFNKTLNLELKQVYQKKFEKEHGHDEFMRVFGKNYL